MPALLYVARKAIQAAEGKDMNIPFECKKLDCLGNHNGHVDFDDVKIVAEQALDEAGNIISGAADVIENIGEGIGNVFEHILNIF